VNARRIRLDGQINRELVDVLQVLNEPPILITQALSPALARYLHDVQDAPGPHKGLERVERIDRMIHTT